MEIESVVYLVEGAPFKNREIRHVLHAVDGTGGQGVKMVGEEASSSVWCENDGKVIDIQIFE